MYIITRIKSLLTFLELRISQVLVYVDTLNLILRLDWLEYVVVMFSNSFIYSLTSETEIKMMDNEL